MPAIADDLGLDQSTMHRSAAAYQAQGLETYPQAEVGCYWGLLTSAQLARPGRQRPGRQIHEYRYIDCRQLLDRVATICRARYTVSGLTNLLHRRGYRYKQTTAVPRKAEAAVQMDFLVDTLAPLLARAEAGTAGVCFADAAHPTHKTRSTHVWAETGKERPLLTISDRECVNRNAVLNALVNS